MDRVRGLRKQLRGLWRKGAVDRELAEELSFHVEQEIAYNVAQGMAPAEARRRALVSFGGVERYTERVRESRGTRWLSDLMADVRHAVRVLARRPGFSAAVIATLGLGIGGTTAIFSVVDGLFLRSPEGVMEASSLRKVYIRRDDGAITTPEGGPGSWVDYESMRGIPAFAGVAAQVGPQLADIGRGAEADQVRTAAVSEGYFEVLGVRPALGRFFQPEEHGAAGEHPVAVISHGMWQARFGGARDVLGRTLLLNGEQLQVVGVAPKGFTGLDADPLEIWLPSAMAGPAGLMFHGPDSDWRTTTGMAAIGYVARLAAGVTEEIVAEQASAALRHAAEAEPSLDPTPEVFTLPLVLAATPYGSPAATLSLWTALVAGLVLVIACANVANLLFARAITRRRELAVRLSLGAGRWRVMRQNLTESLVLALCGGAAGVLLAYWGMGLMRQFPLPPSAGRIDARLLLFSFVLSNLAGVLFGLLPAIRSVQFDPVQGLKDSRAVGSLTRSRSRRALVVVQVSLSLALLVGAALSVLSLRQVTAIDGNVDVDRLLTAKVNLRRVGYTEAEREAFHEQALARLQQVPGVERVAIVHFEPYNGSGMAASWSVPGRRAPEGTEGPYLNMAGPGYFATAGTRLLRGRDFEPGDVAASEPVAIVNEAMARLMADDGNVVGMCVPLVGQVKDGGCTRLVGVVETQRRRFLQDARVPMIFLARAQAPNAITWGGPALLVRVAGRPADHAVSVRAALQGLRSDLPFVSVQPVSERIRRDVLPYRLGATLFALFGVLALALAGIGLHGVLGYFVTERTHEIGIRRSLGAPAGSVVSLVIRQAMFAVMTGVAIGLVAAFAGSRYMESLLFGIDARDVAAFTFASMFLLIVALLATAVPAVRAAKIDPMVALRQD